LRREGAATSHHGSAARRGISATRFRQGREGASWTEETISISRFVADFFVGCAGCYACCVASLIGCFDWYLWCS
jgi:hypothetical protein